MRGEYLNQGTTHVRVRLSGFDSGASGRCIKGTNNEGASPWFVFSSWAPNPMIGVADGGISAWGSSAPNPLMVVASAAHVGSRRLELQSHPSSIRIREGWARSEKRESSRRGQEPGSPMPWTNRSGALSPFRKVKNAHGYTQNLARNVALYVVTHYHWKLIATGKWCVFKPTMGHWAALSDELMNRWNGRNGRGEVIGGAGTGRASSTGLCGRCLCRSSLPKLLGELAGASRVSKFSRPCDRPARCHRSLQLFKRNPST